MPRTQGPVQLQEATRLRDEGEHRPSFVTHKPRGRAVWGVQVKRSGDLGAAHGPAQPHTRLCLQGTEGRLLPAGPRCLPRAVQAPAPQRTSLGCPHSQGTDARPLAAPDGRLCPFPCLRHVPARRTRVHGQAVGSLPPTQAGIAPRGSGAPSVSHRVPTCPGASWGAWPHRHRL